jgi:PAS domain S-box-containing protein
MAAEWQFLVNLNEQLRRLRDPVEIQEVAVRLLGEHLRATRVNYVHIEGDEFVTSRSYVDGVPRFAGRLPLARFSRAIVDACRRGETVAVDDVRIDPRFTDAERGQHSARETAAFVAVPLIKDGRWLASFGVFSRTPRAWTRDQIALVEVTAECTWAAGERARAEEALGRSEGRQAFLRRLNETIRPLADPTRILRETCRLLGTHLHVNRVIYGEIEGDDCTVLDDYVDGLPSMAGRLQWRNLAGSRMADILKGGPLSVNDTSTEPHAAEERTALREAGIGAYICPLLVKDGRFVAAFGIHSRVPRVWTPDEMTLVQEVADRIWATLEHRKAEAELRGNEERLSFLLRLNDALRPLSDPTAVQETAARLVGEHLGASRVGYAEIEGRKYVIRREYTHGVPSLVGHGDSGSWGVALADAYSRGETVVVNNVHSDPRFTPSERVSMDRRQIAAFIGVTLIKRGRLVAAFGANHATPRVWTPTDVALVRDVAERTWEAVERAHAEAELREREHRFRLALAASGGASWTWDVRTNYVHWDDAFRAQFGFPPEEPPLFETWLARVHAEDRPGIRETLEHVFRTQDTWNHTYRVVRPDGALLWMQSLGRADRDATGQVTRLTGLELDITERRRTEEALQARRDEEHDRELRLLLETATQGIVSVDTHGVIVSANRAFGVMFGWAPAELVGLPIECLIPSMLPDGHERRGGQDLVGTRQDGSTFPIEVSVNHVPTPGNGRAFAFVTDITERHRAASALRERTGELEHRTTQLSRMAWELTLAEHHAREQIARTLHDGLQQLLVMVDLNLEQQLKRESEARAAPNELLSEAKHHLDEAMAAARSLHLELFPPVLQRSGLPAALMWLASWAREKYKLEVEIAADPGADTARKDVRTLLFESVRELLFNAVKHAQADRVTLELTLDADDHLCIIVTDHGVGFEPARLDDRSKAGQVGWGLFSIRERLTLLGGRLDLDSAPGRGTRVRLVAPRGAESAVAGANGSSPAPIEPASAGGADRPSPDALRILIVDDHATVRTALREILHGQPQLSVVGDASNGFEAIARAYTLLPDVILMDVAMPYMDGVEATARIRAELPDIQILGLSVQARSQTLHAIEQAGAAGFFVKGMDTKRLVHHLLAVHAARAARDRAHS